MARMIPPVIGAGIPSEGEIEVFRRLRDDPRTSSWVVLHSLNVANHRSQVEGEIDFVIVVPGKGVLCLEVKSSRRIRREDGVWFYGAAEKGDARGPFKQASEAMHSLRSAVVGRRPDFSRIVFWSGVLFPRCDVNFVSHEWHPWQLIRAEEFRRKPISVLVEGILTSARAHLASNPAAKWFHPTSREPYAEQCEELAAELRGNFEFFEHPRTVRQRLDEELKRYTAEQLVALDTMDANPRVMFSGPAGTGKTLLAIESAQRSARAGQATLLLCFNRLLGKWLQEQTASLQPHVTTRTLHEHMVHIAELHNGLDDADSEFWEVELPSMALDRLLEDPSLLMYDMLIVDEAQDIMRTSYLDVLDLSLRGGLASGKWHMFGDFEKQAIYDKSEIGLEDFCQERGNNPARYSLRRNCRNTPRIATFAQHLGCLDPEYSGVLREDDYVDPEIRYYRDDEEQGRLLIEELSRLYGQGFTGSDIVILSPRSACAASRIQESPWCERLRPFGRDVVGGYIRYGTIHSYKGLEAPAVIVTDVDRLADSQQSSSLFYIASSRALHRLTIIAHQRVHRDIVDLLSRHQRSYSPNHEDVHHVAAYRP